MAISRKTRMKIVIVETLLTVKMTNVAIRIVRGDSLPTHAGSDLTSFI